MHTSKFESSAPAPKIDETLEKVRILSFEEKKNDSYDEAKINSFLDKILDFKKSLIEKAEMVEKLVEGVESLTWYDDTQISSESLMKINDLISAIRDLHYSYVRKCTGLNVLRNKGIATVEIKRHKTAMGDLKDAASDLESRFFFLPKSSDFQETTKELSSL